MNIVLLRGRLSSEPRSRALPSGSRLVSYEVTTDISAGRRSSVPVVWFDPPRATPELTAEDEVLVAGEVQRRFFRTGGVTQSRTQVVATRIVPVRRAAQARRVVAALAASLEAAGEAIARGR